MRQKLVLGGHVIKRTIKVTRQKTMDIQSENPLTERSVFQEEVRYFKHLQDVMWVDNAAPDLKGFEKANYMRMRYLITQMTKLRER